MKKSSGNTQVSLERSLKRKLRYHFERLGFERGENGILIPPSHGKDTYRQLHRAQRREKLKKNIEFLAESGDELIHFLANGTEVEPSKIEPKIEWIEGQTWQSDLFRFASLYWSIPVSSGYGRRLRGLVWDKSNSKLIGLLALGDAVFNLRARDSLIGWDEGQRREKLVNMMDAYVLGALPPYSQLLGGKLVASLVRTKEVVDTFRIKYQSNEGLISGKRKRAQLVLATTSSALGRSSIYNRLSLGGTKYFEHIGFTAGWGHFHIPDRIFDQLRLYLESHDDSYASNHAFGEGPNWKMRAIKKALNLLGMNQSIVKHGLERELFVCRLATNAIDYLRGDDKSPNYEDLKTVSEVSELARERWLVPRSLRMPEFRSWSRDDIKMQIRMNVTMK